MHQSDTLQLIYFRYQNLTPQTMLTEIAFLLMVFYLKSVFQCSVGRVHILEKQTPSSLVQFKSKYRYRFGYLEQQKDADTDTGLDFKEHVEMGGKCFPTLQVQLSDFKTCAQEKKFQYLGRPYLAIPIEFRNSSHFLCQHKREIKQGQ